MDYRICAAEGCLGRISLTDESGRFSRLKYCTPSCSPSGQRKEKSWDESNAARKAAGLRVSRVHQHGLGDDEFRALVARGKCDACGSIEPGHKNGWMLDHDHLCCPGAKGCPNCIRGLLCHGCNTALGAIKDDANRLLDLYAYLYRDQGMPLSRPQEALNG